MWLSISGRNSSLSTYRVCQPLICSHVGTGNCLENQDGLVHDAVAIVWVGDGGQEEEHAAVPPYDHMFCIESSMGLRYESFMRFHDEKVVYCNEDEHSAIDVLF